MKRFYDTSVLLLVLVVVGGAIRFVVAGQDLFADELATYWVVGTRDFSGVVETVSTTAEISPPFGFLLSWLTTRIDLTPELIRLPALIAGIASILLVYAIGVRSAGRSPALLAAALTTFSPFMIFYSAEARGYGVMMALVLASTLALLLAIDDGRRRWWVAYAVFVCLAAYTHYTSVFVLATQFSWAFWAHPSARRWLVGASAMAALLYIPWLPSLKGDLESPTTAILSELAPFNLEAVAVAVGHWAIGFPYSAFASLDEMPGLVGLVLLGVALAVTASGLVAERGRLRSRLAAADRRLLLILALAVATPVGEALASAVGSNILGTRNLAASWPYLALAAAALVALGGRRSRWAAAGLALLVIGASGLRMLSVDYQRPVYSDVAEFAAEDPEGVLVDAAAVTPGPLANFDLADSTPGDTEVFRLNIPERSSLPFSFADRAPEPAELVDRVVAAADGAAITIVIAVQVAPVVAGPADKELAVQFVDLLPAGYTLAERRTFRGFMDLEALVYEQEAGQGP